MFSSIKEYMEHFLEKVREVAAKRIVFTEHALEEMNLEGEIISPDEIKEVIFTGLIVEDYPSDKRGHSCLMFYHTYKGRPLHIVCAPRPDYLGVITAYVPTLDKWLEGFIIRRKLK